MTRGLYVRSVSIKQSIPNGNYLSRLPIVRSLSAEPLELTKPVTFIVGENGTGKSTLIEGIAINMGFNPEGGTRNFNFSTQDSHSDLHEYLLVAKGPYKPRDGFFLRAESLYNVATNIDELDAEESFGPRVIDSYGGISLHKQSHGESFLSIVEQRFGGNGIYLLDEPEAALSPMRIMRLMCFMHDLEGRDSQFIISTHSPILMTYPGADVVQLSENGLDHVNYTDTEHYQITRQFMLNPDRMLKYLFEDE